MLLYSSSVYYKAGFAIASIELAIKQENAELKAENERLHNLVTSLHDRNHSMSSEVRHLVLSS